MARSPKGLEDSLAASTARLYVTPAEADELYREIARVFERLFGMDNRFADRRDPKHRPADAITMEFGLMAYPLLDLPHCRRTTRTTRRSTRCDRTADIRARARPKCQTPSA